MEDILLYSVLLPGLAAGVLLLVGGRRHADVGSGAAAAILIAWLAVHGWEWPAFPPPESSASLPLAVLAAGLVTLLPAPDLVRRWLRRVAGFVPALLIAYYVMSTQKTTGGAWTGAIVIFAGCLLAETLATRRPGSEVPTAWMLSFAITAAAFERAGSLYAVRTAGGLAAACGALMLFASWRKVSAAGAVLPLGVALYGLLANTHLFADDFPLSAAVLLGIAPLAAWIGELPLLADRPTWQRLGARLAAVTLVAGIGLAIAAAHATDEESAEDNPYGAYK